MKTNLNSTYHEEIQEYQDRILYYLAHQTRKTYLNAQFNAALLDLNEDGGLLVVDYKMKVLPKTARETKQEFFGKKGWALHTVLLYTKPKDSVEINIQAIDHWSTDARQDAWFSASSLHSVMENLDVKPKWISIISDNGPHYHNSELMIIMSKWYEWYRIHVKKWIFLEAGEAKTTVDSHHAQVCNAKYFFSKKKKIDLHIISNRFHFQLNDISELVEKFKKVVILLQQSRILLVLQLPT